MPAHFSCSELNKRMKVEISNPAKTPNMTGPEQLPFKLNLELLTNTLREATIRAKQFHKTILTSFTQQFVWHDTIRAFSGARQANLGECFFWEQPEEQTALIGI